MSEHHAVERVIKELKALQKWHSIETLSKEIGCALPTVSRDFKELERLGLVIKREGKRTGTRGRLPVEYRLKDDEKDFYKKHHSFPVDYLFLIQLLDDGGRGGLTAEQISEVGEIPMAKVYRMVKTLQAIKWVYVSERRLSQRGKRTSVYKPRFRITMLGE